MSKLSLHRPRYGARSPIIRCCLECDVLEATCGITGQHGQLITPGHSDPSDHHHMSQGLHHGSHHLMATDDHHPSSSSLGADSSSIGHCCHECDAMHEANATANGGNGTIGVHTLDETSNSSTGPIDLHTNGGYSAEAYQTYVNGSGFSGQPSVGHQSGNAIHQYPTSVNGHHGQTNGQIEQSTYANSAQGCPDAYGDVPNSSHHLKREYSYARSYYYF